MIDIKEFKENFCCIKGKTIAIVYIFEGDNSSGFDHFFVWKGKVLTKWINAVEEIHCSPLILDVRTFVEKAINKTLPHIDYVLNMNSGTYDLSSMALVPSTCSSIGIPCIPCNAVSIVAGENKVLSNGIAKSVGLNVPKTFDKNDKNGIFRPINLGNSMGVTRGFNSKYSYGLYQEFIHGYDITTPIVYNPLIGKMELMPTVMFLPDNKDLEWFYGEKEKVLRSGFKFKIVHLDQKLVYKYIELLNVLGVQCFCRIDARVRCKDNWYHNPKNTVVSFDDTFFIEINVMPTIRDGNSFNFSFESIDTNTTLHQCKESLNEIMGNISLNSFLLANSMMSLKTKC